jgi:hypothetical protein
MTAPVEDGVHDGYVPVYPAGHVQFGYVPPYPAGHEPDEPTVNGHEAKVV